MLYSEQEVEFVRLAKLEKWEVYEEDNTLKLIAEGQKFPLCHPYQIHLKWYRESKDVGKKLEAMRRVHHWLWPQHVLTYNYWQDRRFEAHCAGYNRIVMAGGAAKGKSIDGAKIATIFWLANPTKRACVVASTTLDSLESRIWGYVVKLINASAIPIPANIFTGKPPKVLFPGIKDKIHGMFAIAVKQGETENTLGTIIGRHPDEALMVILDEATDISPNIIEALPNLEKGIEFFQMWAIGNSNSRNDLHGALATPKVGWDKIDPMRDKMWETTHRNSICLYFNPYESPAIHEKDPVKKEALSKFLITAEGIEQDKKERGESSAAFYRFTLGFWKPQGMDDTTMSEAFLNEAQVRQFAEWSGFYALHVVAGLDPAFQAGGTGCKLRLALIGHTTSGRVVMDFRREELLYSIDIKIDIAKSAERQICEEVIRILRSYGCPLSSMVMDASGVGRALGELLKVLSGEAQGPYKMVSARVNKASEETDPSIIVVSPSELWLTFKDFVLNGQIAGLDDITVQQITSRMLIKKPGGKLVLEAKEDFKTRMTAINPKIARSPDEADTAMLCLQAAILRYGFSRGQIWEGPRFVDHYTPQFAAKAIAYRREQHAELMAQFEAQATKPALVADFSAGLEEFVPLPRKGSF